MNERAGFLAAIAADPEDYVSRLSYSDWLRDRGEQILAADELKTCGRVYVREVFSSFHDRHRRFIAEVGGCKDVLALMAVAHALGVPRPGDIHPLYGYTCYGLHAEYLSGATLQITCNYE